MHWKQGKVIRDEKEGGSNYQIVLHGSGCGVLLKFNSFLF